MDMKKTFFLFVTLGLIGLFSCEREVGVTSEVIIDCTGSYLRLGEKDYKVCNIEKLKGFDHNSAVTATFKTIEDCEGPGNPYRVCDMYHPFESWVKVLRIQ